MSLWCDALALVEKEAALQKLVAQFEGEHSGKVVPYDLLRVAVTFPGWSVSVEPCLM